MAFEDAHGKGFARLRHGSSLWLFGVPIHYTANVAHAAKTANAALSKTREPIAGALRLRKVLAAPSAARARSVVLNAALRPNRGAFYGTVWLAFGRML